MRIDNHPILRFPKKGKIAFYFNGKKLSGYSNEPIAVALIENGVKVFQHSSRHNRPRGFFCAIGNCSSCLMKVDGVSNTRTCITKLRNGMMVETQKRREMDIE